MRKWLQPHGRRREDRDGSEMVKRQKRRRKGEKDSRSETKIIQADSRKGEETEGGL